MMVRALLVLVALLTGAASASAQEKIKVGYWTSGFSVGFGAVLEAGKFLEQQGLVPEYAHFSGVNGPTKAITTPSTDVACAGPATGPFTLGIQRQPIDGVLPTRAGGPPFLPERA